MKLTRLIQFLDVVSRPGGWSALMAARPRSLASFRITSRLKTTVPEFGTIIDAGANVGQFARAASRAYPNAEIFSFEPLPDVAETLKKNLSDVQQHEVFQTALGSEKGRVKFHRSSSGAQSSSVLPFLTDSQGLMAATGVHEVSQTEVDITTLDATFQGKNLKGPVLLKLDLQGYELEALKGATELLKTCDHVLLETVFERSYQDEPHFMDIVHFLDGHGFVCAGILNAEENERRQICQIDAFFSKKETTNN